MSKLWPSLFRLLLVPRNGSSSVRCLSSQKESEDRIAHIERQFDSISGHAKNKEAFYAAIALFKERRSRQHVEFINAALKHLKEYGVHKDLATYKALLNIFPKGKMIPQNTFQRIMLHYPQQQNCCVKVLDEMEWHGVQPDKEIHDIVVNAFGEWNFASKKMKRMMYWMPKLKYSNKYIDRRKLEGKDLTAAELAAHALKMMARDPGTAVHFIKIGDASPSSSDANLADDFIVSAQSPLQRIVIESMPDGTQIRVDGPFRVYVMEHCVQYVVLSAPPIPEPFEEFEKNEMIGREDFKDWFIEWRRKRGSRGRNIHEQRDQTILAMAVFSRNENKSAQHWLHYLQKSCPSLEKMILRLRLERGVDPLGTVERPTESEHTDAQTAAP